MAGNAIETKKQENGSKVYFELYIEKGVKDFVTLAKAVKKVYPNVNNEWMDSYQKQAVALKEFLGKNKGYEYSRDEREGFMVFIETIAKKKCGVTIKDRWDPADIYMIRSKKKKAIMARITELTKGSNTDTNLLALNDYMRGLLAEYDLLPISLKAIKKSTREAKVEPANAGSKGKTVKFKLVPGSVRCLLEIGRAHV